MGRYKTEYGEDEEQNERRRGLRGERREDSPGKSHSPLQVRDDLANKQRQKISKQGIKLTRCASSALPTVTSNLVLDGIL
jgi:hypothetical protein